MINLSDSEILFKKLNDELHDCSQLYNHKYLVNHDFNTVILLVVM